MRREDWPQRLFAALEARADTAFAWGEFDCCRFAAECVEAITGEDVWPAIDYNSKAGAREFIEEGGGLEAIVSGILGGALPVLCAGRGDVVMRWDDATQMHSLGVVVGDAAAFPARRGVAYVSLAECECAWRVG